MRALLHRYKLLALLLLAFLFRLGFGLCAAFQDADSTQIYLLGLKFYTTHAWPYFGPDVVWGEIQIPGALQALLVGLPFFALPVAEAPYILLNLISFASLCLLAWYCCKRLPGLPRWFVWTWLLTSPWTLNLSTNIYNPSYLLAGSILCLIGALEIYPWTSLNLIDRRLANAMLGFGLLWTMQLHLSWVLLLPYVAIAVYFQAASGARILLKAIASIVLGAALPAALLVPTLWKYGWHAGGTGSAVGFNISNLSSIFGIFKRSLALMIFDVTNFIGGHTAERITFFKQQPWQIPLVAFLTIVAVAQAVMLIVFWFRRDSEQTGWPAIKYLVVGNVCVVYLSFLFSIKPPQSNHLYITFPLLMIYSFCCWERVLQFKRWQLLAKVFLACGIVFHVGLSFYNLPRVSIYPVRARVQSAIEQKDYHILGERRPNTLY
jgi:hypothetical protein